MPKYSLLIFTLLIVSINDSRANEIHALDGQTCHLQSNESNELMIAYQYGYTEIRSKNNHMSDDTGAFLGIHIMKPIDNLSLNRNLYLAAGAHTTFMKDKHIGLMVGFMYALNKTTMISFMPGIMFMKHEATHSNMGMGMNMNQMSVANNEWKTEEAIHIEITHTINLFNRVLNPSFSWMSSSSHNQYSLGLNFHF